MHVVILSEAKNLLSEAFYHSGRHFARRVAHTVAVATVGAVPSVGFLRSVASAAPISGEMTTVEKN